MSKMYFQKNPEILKGSGVHDYGILRAWGETHFEISKGKGGGVKTWKPSVVEYGYFLELPNYTSQKIAQPV